MTFLSSDFGWHYPPGAEDDPRAPWNEEDDAMKSPAPIDMAAHDLSSAIYETICDSIAEHESKFHAPLISPSPAPSSGGAPSDAVAPPARDGGMDSSPAHVTRDEGPDAGEEEEACRAARELTPSIPCSPEYAAEFAFNSGWHAALAYARSKPSEVEKAAERLVTDWSLVGATIHSLAGKHLRYAVRVRNRIVRAERAKGKKSHGAR